MVALKPHPHLRVRDLGLWASRARSGGTAVLSPHQIVFTYSGRGALFQLASQLPNRHRDTVLLPAFHCPTVVDPILEAGYQPRFYAVSENLLVDVEDFTAKLDKSVAAAVVINYMGFPSNLEALRRACQDVDAVVIEDCAHSFLQANPLELAGARGDAAIFSFKKLVPTLVGGGIRINNGSLSVRPPNKRAPARDTLVNCKRLLEEAVNSLESGNVVRSMFNHLEAFRLGAKRGKEKQSELSQSDERRLTFDYPFDARLATVRMPWYARKILERAALDEVATVRRQNFRFLSENLKKRSGFVSVFERLPDRVCPWAFPVIVPNRSRVDIELRKRGVALFTFGETLHPILAKCARNDRGMIERAKFLSSSLLCLSIHQGLTTKDLMDECGIINEFVDVNAAAAASSP